MKKIFVFLVAMIATLFVFSCSTENLLNESNNSLSKKTDEYVDISVNLPNKSRGWDIAKYRVTASKSGEDDVTEETTSSSLTMRLKLGDWSFVASAYDSNGNLIYQSQSSTHSVTATGTAISLLLAQQSSVVKFTGGSTSPAPIKNFSTKIEVVATPSVTGFDIVKASVPSYNQAVFLNRLLANVNYSIQGFAYIGDIIYGETTSATVKPNSTYTVYDMGGKKFTQTKVTPISFSKPSGSSFSTNTKITLDCETSSVSYYYTLDGTTPTTSSTTYSSSSGIVVNSDWVSGKTIKVIATKSGMANSEVAEATYKFDAGMAATPSFSKAGGTYSTDLSITLTNNESSGTLKYSFDGTNWSNYTSPISISGNGTTKTIYAKVTGVTDKGNDGESAVVNQKYIISYNTLGAMTITPSAGTYFNDQTFTIEAPIEGATIYYTTNGSNPTTSSTKYTGAFTLSASATPYSIKAICTKEGYETSAVNDLGSFTIIESSSISFKNAKNLVYNSDKGFFETNGVVNIAKGDNWFVASGLTTGTYEIKWLKSALTPTITVYKNTLNSSITYNSSTNTFSASGLTSTDRVYINFNSGSTCSAALIALGVSGSIIPITTISALSPSSTLSSGFYVGDTEVYSVITTPTDANFGIEYDLTVSNESVISLSGNTVKALATGTSTLKATTRFTSGPSKQTTITVGSSVEVMLTVPDWVWNDNAVLYAWVWGDSSEGAWVNVTGSGTTATMSILPDTAGFLLARCSNGTTQPDWGIGSGDVVNRIYNKTADIVYSRSGSSYEATTWEEYGIQTRTLNLTVPDWIWGDSAEVSIWAWDAEDVGAWYDVTGSGTTATVTGLPTTIVGFKVVRCEVGYPHDWSHKWNESDDITITDSNDYTVSLN